MRAECRAAEQFLVPFARGECRRAWCGSRSSVGDVPRAAGELPDQPGVDGAERELAALRARRAPGTLSSSQAILVPEKYASMTRPVLRHQRLVAGLEQRSHVPPCGDPARRSRCGSACRSPVPDQRGLALVGDADRRESAGVMPALASAPKQRRLRCPDLLGSCSTQPGCGKSARTPLARSRTVPAVEHDRTRAGGALVEGEHVGHRLPHSQRYAVVARTGAGLKFDVCRACRFKVRIHACGAGTPFPTPRVPHRRPIRRPVRRQARCQPRRTAHHDALPASAVCRSACVFADRAPRIQADDGLLESCARLVRDPPTPTRRTTRRRP